MIKDSKNNFLVISLLLFIFNIYVLYTTDLDRILNFSIVYIPIFVFIFFLGIIFPILTIIAFKLEIIPYDKLPPSKQICNHKQESDDNVDNKLMIYVPELKRKLQLCCYQTYRMKEQFCECGKSVPYK